MSNFDEAQAFEVINVSWVSADDGWPFGKVKEKERRGGAHIYNDQEATTLARSANYS